MKHLVIEKSAIRANLQAVKDAAGKTAIYADLSCDAYGLGLLETARLLRDGGVRTFCVSEPRDAYVLRQNGFIEEHILMLRSTADSEELGELIDLNVICTVGSYDAAVALNGLAEERHTVCEVQLKLDVGLGRYGFTAGEMDKIVSIYKYLPNLAVVGTFSTFSDSARDSKLTQSQYAEYLEILEQIRDQGYDPGLRHILDDAALFNYKLDPLDAVRIGPAFAGRTAGKSIRALRRVGYLEAGIEEVGWFPKGHRIGRRTVLRKAARLAVLSLGYYHGFGTIRPGTPRTLRTVLHLKPRRYVRLGSHKAKIMGPAGMLHTIIDVTNIKCSVGDVVVLDVDPIMVKGITRMYTE